MAIFINIITFLNLKSCINDGLITSTSRHPPDPPSFLSLLCSGHRTDGHQLDSGNKQKYTHNYKYRLGHNCQSDDILKVRKIIHIFLQKCNRY